ncbi:hypothetical protein [Streptomyces sp. TS71-3]|nr:hypothetical protein [Streptomyces sp. TS71-3]GHJ36111.1 hypothetical protein Sm713_17200 [Streptomyces sp. TS71-3]
MNVNEVTEAFELDVVEIAEDGDAMETPNASMCSATIATAPSNPCDCI